MPQEDPRQSQHIEKLERDIYNRDFESKINRSQLSREDIPVEKRWEYEHQFDKVAPPPIPPASGSLFKKVLIGAIIFFVLSAAIAAYIFFFGTNIISTDKVTISFSGPTTGAAGDPISIDVAITNNNDSTLLHPTLFISYPDGTEKASDITQDLTHEEDPLEDIPAGGSEHQTLTMVFFGAANTSKVVNVKLQYDIASSNGSYTKETNYTLQLTSSPLTLTVTHPSQIASGQPIDYVVNISSNSNTPLKNLLLQTTYPPGFQFQSANPSPSFDQDLWTISSLAPGEQKTITIHGLVAGEQNDERIVRFAVGAVSSSSAKIIATTYLTTSESVTVQKPPLGLVMTLNNNANQSDTSMKGLVIPNQPVQGQIQIVNNTTSQILDNQIQVAFTGNALDPQSPIGSNGLYHLPNKTINWDKSSDSDLNLLNPGQTATVNFSFSSLSQSVLAGIKSGAITVTASVSGHAINDNVNQFNSSDSQTLKVQPSLTLSSRLVYSVGAFKNVGPVPPKAETRTTYTVIWAIAPSSDDMTSVEVHGTLPGYVQWLGNLSPGNANITWNSSSNEVVWHVGDLSSKATSPVQVSFQVGVVPSTSQIGQAPNVVSDISLTATDNFTQNHLSLPFNPLTTSLSTDPRFQSQSGIVVR